MNMKKKVDREAFASQLRVGLLAKFKAWTAARGMKLYEGIENAIVVYMGDGR